MDNAAIFQHIARHGQICDTDISKALGISLGVVQKSVRGLAMDGKITCCSVIRYTEGKPVSATQCRVSGYIPPAAPGRKPSK